MRNEERELVVSEVKYRLSKCDAEAITLNKRESCVHVKRKE